MRGTRSPQARNRDATWEQIHQLFAALLPEVEPADGWYGEPGGIVDCNSLLDLPDDDLFLEAASAQLLGREMAGGHWRKWRRRLRWGSRALVLAQLRCRSTGRRHGVMLPGLFFALLLTPPHVLAHCRVWHSLAMLRRKLVAARYAARLRTCHGSAVTPGADNVAESPPVSGNCRRRRAS